MPMERDRYPADWEAVAFQVKAAANRHCQDCGRPCRRPDESWLDFALRVRTTRLSECPLVEEIAFYPVRFILTTAHLDQNPANNAPSNLKALCSGCHLRHDAPFRAANRMAKRERQGQLRLEVGV